MHTIKIKCMILQFSIFLSEFKIYEIGYPWLLAIFTVRIIRDNYTPQKQVFCDPLSSLSDSDVKFRESLPRNGTTSRLRSWALLPAAGTRVTAAPPVDSSRWLRQAGSTDFILVRCSCTLGIERSPSLDICYISSNVCHALSPLPRARPVHVVRVCAHVCVCMYVYAHARPLIVVDLLRRGSVIVFGAFSIVWISNDSEPARRTSPVYVACVCVNAWVSQCVARRRIQRNSHLPCPLLFSDRKIFREFYSCNCPQNRNLKVFSYWFIYTWYCVFIAF